LREERRLGVFESSVLRICDPERDEVIGKQIKLHNKELNDLYSSQNIVWVIKSRRIRLAGHVAQRGEIYTGFLLGKLEGKRPLRRSRCRWEDSIKMDLQEVGCGGMEWIDLTWDRERWRTHVNAVMNLRVP